MADQRGLLSGEHFSVGGTLIQTWVGHVLTDNRHGLVVNVQAGTSGATAERDVAARILATVAGPNKRVTVDADKAYRESASGRALAGAR